MANLLTAGTLATARMAERRTLFNTIMVDILPGAAGMQEVDGSIPARSTNKNQ
jgi:hypothetical protein